MNIEGQLKLLLKQGEGETYYSFANADGKRWWMPARHMAVGMNLYQPSGTKGKLLKRGLQMTLNPLHSPRSGHPTNSNLKFQFSSMSTILSYRPKLHFMNRRTARKSL